MKRYKLLKDLPGIKAGNVLFIEGTWGNLYIDNGHSPTGYQITEAGRIATGGMLIQSVAMADWLEEIPEEYKRWRAERGETYYHISDDGEVYDDTEEYHSLDGGCYLIGNYFKTREEAEKAVEWLKAFAILRDDTKGFKPDWRSELQYKWYVYYSHSEKELAASWIWTQQEEVLYFASAGDAEASIKNHEREWLTYFGVEE